MTVEDMTIEPSANDTLEVAAAKSVSRRLFMRNAGVGMAAMAGAGLLASCSSDDAGDNADGGGDGGGDTDTDDTTTVDLVQSDLPEIEVEMATSWPLALATIFGAAEIFAETLSDITGGKMKVTPRAAGELAGGLEVLDVVQNGGAGAGHTAAYYYVGKDSATQFGTAVPFGLTSRQQNAWLYEGGGLEIMQKLYAEEFDVIQFPAGNTGTQMGGWFGKEINTPADLEGLTMRIPGIAGSVLNALGGEQVSIAGGDILTSIETGAIDAAEFVGPYDDVNLGLNQLGSDVFYYYPGWWEPGPSLEVQFPLNWYNDLPAQYQAAIQAAAKAANIGMMARYDALNPESLKQIQAAGVTILPFSDSLMEVFKDTTETVLDEEAAANERFAEILGPWRTFRDDIQAWHGLAETSMLVQATLGQ